MEKCGCEIDKGVIIFCPLHAAAEEMRQSLKRVMRRHIYPDCDCVVCQDARAAILKARGE